MPAALREKTCGGHRIVEKSRRVCVLNAPGRRRSFHIPVVFVRCLRRASGWLPVVGAWLGPVVRLLAQRTSEDVAMLKFAEKPAVFWCHQSRSRHGAESALFVYRRSEREAERKRPAAPLLNATGTLQQRMKNPAGNPRCRPSRESRTAGKYSVNGQEEPPRRKIPRL
jgi:hypothetical protein